MKTKIIIAITFLLAILLVELLFPKDEVTKQATPPPQQEIIKELIEHNKSQTQKELEKKQLAKQEHQNKELTRLARLEQLKRQELEKKQLLQAKKMEHEARQKLELEKLAELKKSALERKKAAAKRRELKRKRLLEEQTISQVNENGNLRLKINEIALLENERMKLIIDFTKIDSNKKNTDYRCRLYDKVKDREFTKSGRLFENYKTIKTSKDSNEVTNMGSELDIIIDNYKIRWSYSSSKSGWLYLKGKGAVTVLEDINFETYKLK